MVSLSSSHARIKIRGTLTGALAHLAQKWVVSGLSDISVAFTTALQPLSSTEEEVEAVLHLTRGVRANAGESLSTEASEGEEARRHHSLREWWDWRVGQRLKETQPAVYDDDLEEEEVAPSPVEQAQRHRDGRGRGGIRRRPAGAAMRAIVAITSRWLDKARATQMAVMRCHPGDDRCHFTATFFDHGSRLPMTAELSAAMLPHPPSTSLRSVEFHVNASALAALPNGGTRVVPLSTHDVESTFVRQFAPSADMSDADLRLRWSVSPREDLFNISRSLRLRGGVEALPTTRAVNAVCSYHFSIGLRAGGKSSRRIASLRFDLEVTCGHSKGPLAHALWQWRDEAVPGASLTAARWTGVVDVGGAERSTGVSSTLPKTSSRRDR